VDHQQRNADQPWDTRRCSFGGAADRYDRIRPSYPREAVRWLLEPVGDGPLRVVDVGAGTGILTRVLLTLGHEVSAVEPDPAMRAQLIAATPEITPLAGSAEAIDVPDNSVDAVVAGQAYHWFDPERAHPEIARVLRPGGVFGPIWNDRDERIGWLAELSRIADGLTTRNGGAEPGPTRIGPWFTAVEHATFQHATSHTVDSLVELVQSRSYYLTASPELRDEIVSRIRAMVAEHPDLRGTPTFELPYVTRAYRATRLRLPRTR
jgi:SAM-dependent methyltransferase